MNNHLLFARTLLPHGAARCTDALTCDRTGLHFSVLQLLPFQHFINHCSFATRTRCLFLPVFLCLPLTCILLRASFLLPFTFSFRSVMVSGA